MAAPVPAAGGGLGGALGGLGQRIGGALNTPAGGNLLSALGYSLMSSPRNAPLQNFGQFHTNLTANTLQQQRYDQQQQEAERQRQEEAASKNQTAAWLKSNFGLSDDEALAAAQNPTILQHYLKQAQGGSRPRYSLNPIYGTDPEGNTVISVLGDDASLKTVDTGGVKISTGVDRVDVGTHYNLIDKRSGQMVGTLPKENYQEAFDTAQGGAEGKAAGEANANLESEMITARQTIQELDELIAHPGLSAIAGPVDQFRPSWSMGAEGRDALARFNQAKGRAFLQAFGMLKGGGAITEIEGLKAEQAMARMDRAQSEPEFIQALKDFREAVASGMTKLQRRSSGGGASRAPTAPARTSSGVQWSFDD
ncbi:hypothetical protein [Aquamicrobium zhengzhouense]|uniref:Uncharacterized protein n=1 Tax=Aquamicrobium zhengzhouense TaxID=2781738 RepID=A0ABS0SAQ2_9HYPH|nr:hypothetical protein [Aquamicrobium zhengzhouense]MBI1620368.1 hypothetical protein [Aquamicrobium zhengzhouense]